MQCTPLQASSIRDLSRPGGGLIVVKLDLVGRNTRDVLNLVHEAEEKGASLRVLEPAIDTAGPMGRMVLTVLGMVAVMELGFIRDRQRAGIDAAKAKGICKGRPTTFDRARIVSLRKEGMGATEIAKAVGCKRGNVYKSNVWCPTGDASKGGITTLRRSRSNGKNAQIAVVPHPLVRRIGRPDPCGRSCASQGIRRASVGVTPRRCATQ
jgi:Resolvase, N terminal domain